jgi:hypothetical protein
MLGRHPRQGDELRAPEMLVRIDRSDESSLYWTCTSVTNHKADYTSDLSPV